MSKVSPEIQAIYDDVRAKDPNDITPRSIELARREGIASGSDEQVTAQLRAVIRTAQDSTVEEFASFLRGELLPVRELSAEEMESASAGGMYSSTAGADWDGR